MHLSALNIGRAFFELYAQPDSRILDVGSYDVNGTLRQVAPPGAPYTGIDLTAGPGVDLVLEDPRRYPFPADSFDLVVSTSCFEHDPMFWVSFLEMLRVLRPGGYIYVNAPSNGGYHGFPRDHWRFYPDAGLALQDWGRMMGQTVSLVESFIAPQHYAWFNDCVMVFAKGQPAARAERLAHRIEGITNYRLAEQPDVLGNAAEHTQEGQFRIHAILELRAMQARMRELERVLMAEPPGEPPAEPPADPASA